MPLGHMENITDERDVLDQGMKDLSIYIEASIEDTGAVINAAITAGVCRLIYMSSTGVVFDSTDVMNVDEQVPYLEKPYDMYNDAQGVFGPRGCQISGSNNLFDCTYVRSIASAHRLIRNELVPPLSYSSTMSSKPRLDPEDLYTTLSLPYVP
ncbi:hypothetical protein BKA82DRAFT_4361209 [Pisolithus tinctorius]|nr:hypothetical protein BKA82DRAFT_4361209 [Pisolithus tinctorius]